MSRRSRQRANSRPWEELAELPEPDDEQEEGDELSFDAPWALPEQEQSSPIPITSASTST